MGLYWDVPTAKGYQIAPQGPSKDHPGALLGRTDVNWYGREPHGYRIVTIASWGSIGSYRLPIGIGESPRTLSDRHDSVLGLYRDVLTAKGYRNSSDYFNYGTTSLTWGAV